MFNWMKFCVFLNTTSKNLLMYWIIALIIYLLLAIGMVIILSLAARHVGFTALQWVWLILVTIGLAGLCTWIITLED